MNNEYYGVKISPMSIFNLKQIPNAYFNEVSYLYKFSESDNLIQKLICSFHDYDNLYFVSKFYDGYIINYLNNYWSEKHIQFFSACLIECFINLRKENLIHRDIHFGNLVLDEKQYINLIDFHIVMDYNLKNDPRGNIVGAPELCAPEMIKGLEYDFNSDYYRLGSMLFYILFRKYPNYIMKKKNISQIIINANETRNISESCINFINHLIITNNTKRLGYTNIDELTKHEFFKNFDWKKFFDKNMVSPFSRIKRRNLGLCNKNINITKKISINTNLSKNEKFKKTLYSFDKLNSRVINEIFKNIENRKL